MMSRHRLDFIPKFLLFLLLFFFQPSTTKAQTFQVQGEPSLRVWSAYAGGAKIRAILLDDLNHAIPNASIEIELQNGDRVIQEFIQTDERGAAELDLGLDGGLWHGRARYLGNRFWLPAGASFEIKAIPSAARTELVLENDGCIREGKVLGIEILRTCEDCLGQRVSWMVSTAAHSARVDMETNEAHKRITFATSGLTPGIYEVTADIVGDVWMRETVTKPYLIYKQFWHGNIKILKHQDKVLLSAGIHGGIAKISTFPKVVFQGIAVPFEQIAVQRAHHDFLAVLRAKKAIQEMRVSSEEFVQADISELSKDCFIYRWQRAGSVDMADIIYGRYCPVAVGKIHAGWWGVLSCVFGGGVCCAWLVRRRRQPQAMMPCDVVRRQCHAAYRLETSPDACLLICEDQKTRMPLDLEKTRLEVDGQVLEASVWPVSVMRRKKISIASEGYLPVCVMVRKNGRCTLPMVSGRDYMVDCFNRVAWATLGEGVYWGKLTPCEWLHEIQKQNVFKKDRSLLEMCNAYSRALNRGAFGNGTPRYEELEQIGLWSQKIIERATQAKIRRL